MELFNVTIEFSDPVAYKEWEEEFALIQEQGNDRRLAMSAPKPKTDTVQVAVHGSFGVLMVMDAAAGALESRIGGDKDTWERYRAIVRKVEYVGSVAVPLAKQGEC